MKKPYEPAVLVDLGSAEELVLGPFDIKEDNAGGGQQLPAFSLDD